MLDNISNSLYPILQNRPRAGFVHSRNARKPAAGALLAESLCCLPMIQSFMPHHSGVSPCTSVRWRLGPLQYVNYLDIY